MIAVHAVAGQLLVHIGQRGSEVPLRLARRAVLEGGAHLVRGAYARRSDRGWRREHVGEALHRRQAGRLSVHPEQRAPKVGFHHHQAHPVLRARLVQLLVPLVVVLDQVDAKHQHVDQAALHQFHRHRDLVTAGPNVSQPPLLLVAVQVLQRCLCPRARPVGVGGHGHDRHLDAVVAHLGQHVLKGALAVGQVVARPPAPVGGQDQLLAMLAQGRPGAAPEPCPVRGGIGIDLQQVDIVRARTDCRGQHLGPCLAVRRHMLGAKSDLAYGQSRSTQGPVLHATVLSPDRVMGKRAGGMHQLVARTCLPGYYTPSS